jgi:hypothetical protein
MLAAWNDAPARKPGGKDFFNGNVKTDRSKLQHAIRRRQPVHIDRRHAVVHEATMRKLHATGLPRRT